MQMCIYKCILYILSYRYIIVVHIYIYICYYLTLCLSWLSAVQRTHQVQLLTSVSQSDFGAQHNSKGNLLTPLVAVLSSLCS